MKVITIYYKQIISTVADSDCTFSFQQTMQETIQQEKQILFEKVLSSYGIASSDYQIDYRNDKKPYLSSHPDIHFNISHTTNHRCMDKNACLAIGFSPVEIGIDVEFHRDITPAAAKRICSPEEYSFYSTCENPTDYLTRLWTLKEAYVKYTGAGLKTDFHTLNFTLVSDSGTFGSYRTYQLSGHPEVVLYHYELTDGLYLSVCVNSQVDTQIVLRCVDNKLSCTDDSFFS